jgi:hypothetical protein
VQDQVVLIIQEVQVPSGTSGANGSSGSAEFQEVVQLDHQEVQNQEDIWVQMDQEVQGQVEHLGRSEFANGHQEVQVQ